MDFEDYLPAVRARLPEVAGEIAGFHGVSDVLSWMERRGLAGAAVEIVGHDEFEFDFLVELKTHGCWLAFGLT